jgi:hypothetical protein
MKARIVLALAVILVLVVTGSASVAASGPEAPFYTSLRVHPTLAPDSIPGGFKLSVPGEGQARHLGKCNWDAAMWVYFDGSQHGEMEFTAANGDQLVGTFDGHGYRDSAGVSHFDGTYEFTGGTGRFWGATGEGDYWGAAVLNGDGVLYFEGTLIKWIK